MVFQRRRFAALFHEACVSLIVLFAGCVQGSSCSSACLNALSYDIMVVAQQLL